MMKAAKWAGVVALVILVPWPMLAALAAWRARRRGGTVHAWRGLSFPGGLRRARIPIPRRARPTAPRGRPAKCHAPRRYRDITARLTRSQSRSSNRASPSGRSPASARRVRSICGIGVTYAERIASSSSLVKLIAGT